MHAHMTTLAYRRLNRSAVTLLEVLIVLALLAGLTAIIAPAVMSRLDERAFEAAADGTSEQLMMARAHAQATGEAVEVTYSPATGEVQARVYAPWDAAGDVAAIEPGTSPLASAARGSQSRNPSDSRADSALPLLDPSSSASEFDSDQAGRAIAENWAIRPLGRGIRIGTHPPSGAENGELEEICLPDGTMITVDARDAELEELANGQDVRLAVFMPDGSAMVGEELWLDDGQGRYGRITINPWSGLPLFHRLANLLESSIDATTERDDAGDSFDANSGDDRDMRDIGGNHRGASPIDRDD